MNGFNQIQTRELPTWVRVLKNKEPSEMLIDLQLIDDLLTIVKSKSLLVRKKKLKTQLENRISFECGHKTINLNVL